MIASFNIANKKSILPCINVHTAKLRFFGARCKVSPTWDLKPRPSENVPMFLRNNVQTQVISTQ